MYTMINNGKACNTENVRIRHDWKKWLELVIFSVQLYTNYNTYMSSNLSKPVATKNMW